MSERRSWLDIPPFPRRWPGHIAIKLIVLVIAIHIALFWASRWRGLI